eukprot:COSAG05_NODE_76_length_21413_cov_40.065122_9_plen_774_part_00
MYGRSTESSQSYCIRTTATSDTVVFPKPSVGTTVVEIRDNTSSGTRYNGHISKMAGEGATKVARMEADIRALTHKLGKAEQALRRASPPRTQSGGSSDSNFMSPVALEGDCDYDDDMTDDGEMTDPSRRPGAGGSHAPSPQSPSGGSIGVRRLAAEAQVAELQRRLEEAAEAHAREVGELREKLQGSKKDTAETLGHAESLASAVEELEEELTAVKNENRQLRQRAAKPKQQPGRGPALAWMAQLVVDSGVGGQVQAGLAQQLTAIAAGIRQEEEDRQSSSGGNCNGDGLVGEGVTKTGMPTLLEAAAVELEEHAASLAREREAHAASARDLESAKRSLTRLEQQYAVKELQCGELQQQQQQQPGATHAAAVPGYASPVRRHSPGAAEHRPQRRFESPPGTVGALRPSSRGQQQSRRPLSNLRSPHNNTTAAVAANWSSTLRSGRSTSTNSRTRRPSSSRRRSVSNSSREGRTVAGWMASARGGGDGRGEEACTAAPSQAATPRRRASGRVGGERWAARQRRRLQNGELGSPDSLTVEQVRQVYGNIAPAGIDRPPPSQEQQNPEQPTEEKEAATAPDTDIARTELNLSTTQYDSPHSALAAELLAAPKRVPAVNADQRHCGTGHLNDRHLRGKKEAWRSAESSMSAIGTTRRLRGWCCRCYCHGGDGCYGYSWRPALLPPLGGDGFAAAVGWLYQYREQSPLPFPLSAALGFAAPDLAGVDRCRQGQYCHKLGELAQQLENPGYLTHHFAAAVAAVLPSAHRQRGPRPVGVA